MNTLLNINRIKHFITNNTKTIGADDNTKFTESKPVKYRWSHGATDSYIGDGLLIYSLIYYIKAKTCVCLGSGGGFVPRIMTQARQDLHSSDIFSGSDSMEWGDIGTTILVDANNGKNGQPDYIEEDSFFRKYFTPRFINETTEDAFYKLFAKEDIKIDYLHIDADHSLEGVKKDFELYSSIMNPYGIISIHDTDISYYESYQPGFPNDDFTGPTEFVKELIGNSEWEIFNLFNHGIQRDKPSSTGLTLFQKNKM